MASTSSWTPAERDDVLFADRDSLRRSVGHFLASFIPSVAGGIAAFAAFAVASFVDDVPRLIPFLESPVLGQVFMVTVVVATTWEQRPQLLVQRMAKVLAFLAFVLALSLVGALALGWPHRFARHAVVYGSFLVLFVTPAVLAAGEALRHLADRMGLWRRAVVFGDAIGVRIVGQQLLESPQLGCRPVAYLVDGEERLRPSGIAMPPIVERADEQTVRYFLARLRADELLVVPPLSDSTTLSRIAATCEAMDVRFTVVDPLWSKDLIKRSSAYEMAKRALDAFVSGAIFVVTLPLQLLIAALVRLDSPGPIFFEHHRIGRDGRPFPMRKFRTMRTESSPYSVKPNDPEDTRVTRVGRWLRWTSLDELPQLSAVLRGHMSLVGPRPEMGFLVDGYTDLERERLSVKPGITGLWQIHEARHHPIHEHVEYDLFYAANRTIFLDLAILSLTPFRMVNGV